MKYKDMVKILTECNNCYVAQCPEPVVLEQLSNDVGAKITVRPVRHVCLEGFVLEKEVKKYVGNESGRLNSNRD